ncbi:Arf GTPase activating protein, partial [Atractiella rhizophila]
KENKERNAARLKNLKDLNGNTVCADCQRPDPRWASWKRVPFLILCITCSTWVNSLGVFICISCSGVHRSLGTHISKVRSVDLDDWSDDHLKNMESIGNNASNLYWEAKLPPAEKP